MKIPVTSGGGEAREVPEAGPTPAVFVAIIDCGTHEKDYGQGEGAKQTHEVYLAWELPGQEIPGTKGGRNHVIARTYTVSLHERAALRKVIDALAPKKLADGDTFDLQSLLGTACQLNLAHKVSKGKGLTFAVVDGVTKVMKGVKVPPATYEPVYFEVGGDRKLPGEEWLPYLYDGAAGKMVHVSDYVKSSHEWKGSPVGASAEEDQPF